VSKQTVLVIDDEPQIRRVVKNALGGGALGTETRVIEATSGSEGLDLAAAERPDLVVLDLGLPDRAGLDVCRDLRGWSKAPILVLSARHSDVEKAALLDGGADDYVTKPFSPDELLARIRVALRRVFAEDEHESGQETFGDLTIDFDRHRVVRDGEEIRLTPKEFDLLQLLARNAGRVLTNRKILKAIWGSHAVNQPEHLWVLMGQLRKKIERDPSKPEYLVSEPWVGYRFVAERS